MTAKTMMLKKLHFDPFLIDCEAYNHLTWHTFYSIHGLKNVLCYITDL